MKARPALPPDIKELMRLVRAGKLFAVQKWIADGRPVTPPKPYWFSPLRVAVKSGFHSMIELLLRLGVEQTELNYMLNHAVWDGDFEVIQLLVEYGADIQAVDFEDVCRTGHPFIIRYFLDRGIDAETDYPFARALCFPKHRYLGVYMKYRHNLPTFNHQLNLALKYHAQHGNLKWVSLLLWAGGDGHLRLPMIGEPSDRNNDTSAIEDALLRQHFDIVDKIGLNPRRDNLQRMFQTACNLGNSKVVDRLLPLGANPRGPKGDDSPMQSAISHFRWEMEEQYGFRSEASAKHAIGFVVKLADLGARWAPDGYEVRRVRSLVCQFDRGFMQHMVREFIEHQVCARAVLYKLMDSPKVKEKFGYGHDKLLHQLKSGAPVTVI